MKKNIKNKIISISIKNEIEKSYLNYAMSVIIGRALPDVRDGLKPVHRRILYTMYKIKNFYNKPFIKCARIVGEVMGKYHPHGDTSIYEALVRMAQNFSLRYNLIEGQGNFGSIDGDNAAAMRYTECRLSKISNYLLNDDIKKKTINFNSNYDGKEKEPSVLTNKIPNLLINGSSGIAVGMSTNIPPHNFSEVINASLYLLKNKNCSINKIIKYIKAPDFPTGGVLYNIKDIQQSYYTGKGKVIIKSNFHIEKKKKKKFIIIDDIPYQVNKINLLKSIIKIIKKKKIKNILNIKDESNKLGIRIVIEIKNKKSYKEIIKILYNNTQLTNIFTINMVALVNYKPKLLNIKKILNYFLIHRFKIITKKIKFKLKKEKKKKHILKGVIISLYNIKNIIKIIKKSKTKKIAKNKIKFKKWNFDLNNKIFKLKNNIYIFSNLQINKILKIKLQNITHLKYKKNIIKYNFLKKKIKKYEKILINKKKINNIIYNELLKIKKNIKNDKRLSKIKN